jgi:hypothetical protein
MGPTSPLGDPRPPLVSQTSETYEKAQEDEREVLKAVFMDDYEESEARGAWSVSAESRPCEHSYGFLRIHMIQRRCSLECIHVAHTAYEGRASSFAGPSLTSA